MSLHEIQIKDDKIFFDIEKTKNNKTNSNRPCQCQYCRNYYINIQKNCELIDFLTAFGVDYLRPEEIMSYDLGYDMDSLINYSVYYLVFGNLDSGFCVNKESFFASFDMVKNINVGHEISEDYFFIVIDINLPFVLDEERDLPVSFNKKLISKIKDFFRKN